MKLQVKGWLTVFFLISLLWGVGYLLGERTGFALGVLLSVLLVARLRWPRAPYLAQVFGASLLEGSDSYGVQNLLGQVSHQNRIPRPQVFLVPSNWPILFSTGTKPSNSSLFISVAVLERFSTEELRALLTWELLGIQKRQNLTANVGQTLSSLLLWGGRLLDGLRSSRKQEGSPQIFQELLAPLAAAPLKGLNREKDFFEIDQEASRILANPDLMARSLWKLDSLVKSQPLEISPTFSPFFPVGPLTPHRYGRYFDVQPEIEQRVRRLVGHYPV